MEIVTEDGCDEFDVILLEVPEARIPVLKIVREVTGWTITEAREQIENAPVRLVEATSMRRAVELKRELDGVGAKAEVRACG